MKIAATMENEAQFLVFKAAFIEMAESAEILRELGAEPAAIKKVADGIEDIAMQLRRYADAKDEQVMAEVEKDLAAIRLVLNIGSSA